MGQLQKLKAEIDNDPEEIGYASMADDQAIADSLMAETRSKDVMSVRGSQVGDAVDKDEYDALSDADKAAVRELVQVPSLNPFGFAAIVIKDVFPNNGVTIAALVAMRTTSLSRAKELGAATEFVTAAHVIKARGL